MDTYSVLDVGVTLFSRSSCFHTHTHTEKFLVILKTLWTCVHIEGLVLVGGYMFNFIFTIFCLGTFIGWTYARYILLQGIEFWNMSRNKSSSLILSKSVMAYDEKMSLDVLLKSIFKKGVRKSSYRYMRKMPG